MEIGTSWVVLPAIEQVLTYRHWAGGRVEAKAFVLNDRRTHPSHRKAVSPAW